MRLILPAASLALMSGLAPAYAQTQPAPAANDEIVVLAERGDQSRIDRQVYTLRNDAAAQSTNMFDVLGRIPSVAVAPSGAVTLLGAGDVTIQINGQPVPGGNLEQSLRGIPGGQVERIEVITNPSAQYSAQASGGIINIVTKSRFEGGLNGSLQANVDSFGGGHFGLSPSWTRGPWSLSGQVGGWRGENDTTYFRDRQYRLGGTENERGANFVEFEGWYAGSLRASYKPDERQRFSVTLDGNDFGSHQLQTSTLSTPAGPISSRRFAAENEGQFQAVVFDYQNEHERKVNKVNLALNRNINDNLGLNTSTAAVSGAISQYVTMFETETLSANLKFDAERPLSDERLFTFGSAFESAEQTNTNALQALLGTTPLPYSAELSGVRQTLAAYATYQFDTGEWTWLPGVRVEDYRRELRSGGIETDAHDLRTFPSLHVRRKIGESFNVDVSYTSRIQRPGFGQLDPVIRYFAVDRGFSGNPALRPTTTDAYEAKVDWRKGPTSVSLTAFDRISDDIVSGQNFRTPDGVFLNRPVNAGTSEQRGVQILARGPIVPRWRYSLSANVLNRQFDALTGATIERRSEFEYDGNAQLDFRDPDQAAVGADQVQFDLRFQGPRYQLQSETDAFVVANVSWRRRIARRVLASVSANDLFDSAAQVFDVSTPEYMEQGEFGSPGTIYRFSLTYQFGANPRPDEPQQQQQQPPPPPIQ